MGHQVIKSNKNIQENKSSLFEINEGIGDILIYTSKIKKNEVMEMHFQKYKKMVLRLFDLIEEDYKKFINLIADDEFLEEWENNKENASLKLNMIPEEQFTNLKIIINQFSRLHELSKFKNKEVSKLSIYCLSNILKNISTQENGGIFIRIILDRFLKLLNENINNEIDTIHMISIDWYINYLRLEENNFDYINLYNHSFKKSVSLIIKNNKAKLFKSLVGSLIDGISVVYKNEQAIYDYTSLLLPENINIYKSNNIDEKCKTIVDKSRKIYTKNDFNEWNKKVNEVKNIVRKLGLGSSKNNKLIEIEKKVSRWGRDNFKFNIILIISCYMGAYSLYAERYSFINKIWNYKQPHDAVARHAGHNIYPSSIEKIFSLIFDYNVFNERFAYYEDHHDISPYMKKYILLNIIKIYINKKDSIKKPKIDKLNSIELSNLEYTIKELKNIFDDLIKDKKIFDNLDFNNSIDIEEVKDDIDLYFSEILEIIPKQQNIILRSGELDNKKIREFKNVFYENYYENSTIKNMFNNLGLLNINKMKKNPKNNFSIHKITKRGIFLKNWYINYSMAIEQYGRSFAHHENKVLLNKLLSTDFKNVINIKFDKLEKTIGEKINELNQTVKSNSLTIFMTGLTYLPRYLTNIDNFKMKNTTFNTKTILVGHYFIKDLKIPVYYYRCRDVENQILIFDYNKIGNVDQFILSSNYEENIQFNKEKIKYFFEFKILDLSNEDDRQKFIKETNYSDDLDRLKDKVSILIHENFDFNKKYIDSHGWKLKFDD